MEDLILGQILMMKVFNILCKIFHEFQYVFIVLIDALRKSFQENLKKI